MFRVSSPCSAAGFWCTPHRLLAGQLLLGPSQLLPSSVWHRPAGVLVPSASAVWHQAGGYGRAAADFWWCWHQPDLPEPLPLCGELHWVPICKDAPAQIACLNQEIKVSPWQLSVPTSALHNV